MGYGIISRKDKQLALILMDVLKLGNKLTSGEKLAAIFHKVLEMIDNYHPDEFAIEAPFYGKNVQSMLKLGRAQGVAMAAAVYRQVPIFEYSPRKVKQSITGRGAASKEQVAAMLFRLLHVSHPPDYLDATDAVAVAMCHMFQGAPKQEEDRYSGWDAFISRNPGRVG